MIKATKKAGKIPLFYAYIIAFEARYRKNLQDCDVSPNNNLCTDGSNFIRDNRVLLVSRYSHHAKAIATALGDKNAPTIWVSFKISFYKNNFSQNHIIWQLISQSDAHFR